MLQQNLLPSIADTQSDVSPIFWVDVVKAPSSQHFPPGWGRDLEDACAPTSRPLPRDPEASNEPDTLLGVGGRRPTSPVCVTVAHRQVLQLPALPT